MQDEIAQQQKERSVTFSGANDILTATLGPEHPGSVREKGKGAVPTSYFNIPRRTGGKDGLVKIMLEEQRKLLENERRKQNEERKIYAQQISALQDEIRAMSTQQLQTTAATRRNVFEKVSYLAQNYGKPVAPNISQPHVNKDIELLKVILS